jgi:hypothetical protein
MNYLRKNSKYIMVVMCIVCMLTFVVGSSLLGLADAARRAAADPNPVVVTWTKGNLRGHELQALRHRHHVVHQFLLNVIETALQRGGRPVVGGRQISNIQQIAYVGIPSDNSDESVVQTMVLAEEARRMGIVVDPAAVKDFLGMMSSPELREGDWLQLAQELTQHQNLSVSQLFEHLAYELKAEHVRNLAVAGLYAHGVGPIVPPGEAWELFNRLNRRLTIEAYPIDVASRVVQVKAEPTAADLQKLFDEGKFRDPDPNIDEPGFHKPHKLAFSYVKVNFTPFLDEAKKQITDAQIEEAYQKDIEQGIHKVPELPPATPGGNDDKKDGAATESDKTESAKKDAEKSPDAKPAGEKPDSSGKEADKPAEEQKNSPPSGCGSDEPAATDKPVEEKSKKDDAAAEPHNSTAEKTSSETKPAAPGADAKSDEAKPAADVPAPPKEQKFKPLSEVREQILARLAQPIAEEARKKAVGEVISAVEKYGKTYRRYLDVKTVKKTEDIADPGKLDIVPLALKHDFPIGDVPLVDQYEISRHEIGQKVQQFDMAAAQRGQFRMLSFADIAFGQDQPLYKPEEARSSEPDVSYVYWRTAEEKPADVTLKDVRQQVVDYWKMRKAFDLTMTEAQALVERAKGTASLSAIAADATQIIAPRAFSWMTAGGFGFGQPEMSTVEGIELAGREFMQAVFALQPGEFGVAPNQARSRIYVVHVISQDPDDEKLRAQFLESGYNNMIMMMAQREAGETSYQWYRGVADAYQVKWQRPPQDFRRM